MVLETILLTSAISFSMFDGLTNFPSNKVDVSPYLSNSEAIANTCDLAIDNLIDSNSIQTCASVSILVHGLGGKENDFIINNFEKNLYLSRHGYSFNSSSVSQYEYSLATGSIIDLLLHSHYRFDAISNDYLESNNFFYSFGFNDDSFVFCKFYETSPNHFIKSYPDNIIDSLDVNKNIVLVYNSFGNYSSDLFIESLNTILYYIALKQCGVLPKINLIGHSKGGLFCVDYAIRYPELVQNLFTLGSPLGNLTYSKEFLTIADFLDLDLFVDYSDLFCDEIKYRRCCDFNSISSMFHSRSFSFFQTASFLRDSLVDLVQFFQLENDTEIVSRDIEIFLYYFETILSDISRETAHNIISSINYLISKGISNIPGYVDSLFNILNFLIDDYLEYSIVYDDSIFSFDTLVNNSSAIGSCFYFTDGIPPQFNISSFNFDNCSYIVIGSDIGGDVFSIDRISEYDMPIIAHNLETKSEEAGALIHSDLNQYSGFHDHSFVDGYSNNEHFQRCACGAYREKSNHNLILSENNEQTHTFCCTSCNFSFTSQHQYEYTYFDASTHVKTCSLCGDSMFESHKSSVYTANGVSKHDVHCSCGFYYGTEAHQFRTMTSTCRKCGFRIGTGGGGVIIGPIISN